MFLSDVDILIEIEKGNIKIEPFDEDKIQPASIDLRLGDEFLIPDYYELKGVIKLGEKQDYIKKETERIIIPPGDFILGTTLEHVAISKGIVGILQGKSSVGRSGLFVFNAGLVNPGFEGNLTLELHNANRSPIELKAGKDICQIMFSYLKTPSRKPYHGRYQEQTGVAGA